MNINSKYVHMGSVLFYILALVGALLLWPDLKKDQPTTFGTFGVFVTLYGVTFSVIELMRLKSASKLAKEEARRVFVSITNMVTAREITECQTKIENVLAAIDENYPVSLTNLHGIVKLYSQVFHEEVQCENSDHRKNRSIIESYYIHGKRQMGVSKNTKTALLRIAGHLAQLQGSTNNFSEYTR